MQLSLQNFSTLVDSMAATVQGACSSLIDLTVGSVLRAMLEASASVALWLQYLMLQVLTMTRLSTSVGADADSWVGDFGLTCLPAAFASGQVILTSFNPGSQASAVPNGATVRTSDGSQTFSIINGPYTRPVGTSSVSVEVQAVTAGPAGNVQSGVVNMLGSAISGIDTVINPNAFTGGSAAESDAALRLRFVSYINTRSQATEQAFGFAIASVQQNLTYTIQENITANGTFAPGHVHIIVDDGSGSPPASLISAIAVALDLVRPVGTTISVAGPSVLIATISCSLTVVDLGNAATVEQEVNAALTSFINSLGVGQILPYSRIPGLCYDADTDVVNVQSVLLNNAAADLGGQSGTVVRAGVLSITVVGS